MTDGEVLLMRGLVIALRHAIEAADRWYDDDHGGPCPDLDDERKLLQSLLQKTERV